MATMGVIVTEMALCLLAALGIGAFFAYFYAKSSAKAYYEDKIDALQELCESKRKEAEAIKEQYLKLEIESAKNEEEAKRCEALLVACREKEEALLTQLDLIAQENASLQQKLDTLDPDSSGHEVLAKEIAELKKMLDVKHTDLTAKIKDELMEDLTKAEKMLKEGVKTGKITSFIQTILGKIRPN